MSALPTAYTPLESLLFFQALRNEATGPSRFSQISGQLQKIPAIRNDATYDPGRLSPDALRELYLALLKEEVKADLERRIHAETSLTNGDVSPGSRKRKAPSPPLPTVREAEQHEHLIPHLVSRLYELYRNATILKLRNNENKYEFVKNEVVEIEAGGWDDSLQRKRAISQTQSPKPSPKPSSTAHTQPHFVRNEKFASTASTSASPVLPQKPLENSIVQQPFKPVRIDAVMNHGPEPQDSHVRHRRESSQTSLPPLSAMTPGSPRFGIPPKIAAHVPPQLQPMPHGNQGYTHSPPPGHQSPYAAHQHAHPRQGSMGSPQLQHTLSRPSSSPRPTLPLPKGMPIPPSPVPHAGSAGVSAHAMPHQPPPQQYQPMPPQHYQSQHRMSTGVSPTSEGPPRGYPSTPMQHHTASYYQHPQPFSDRRTSYPQQQYPPPYPQPPPQAGGYMVPTFQVAQQRPMQHQQPIRPHQLLVAAQAPVHHPPQTQYAPSTGPRPHPVSRPSAESSDIVAHVGTPSRPHRARPRRPSLWSRSSLKSPRAAPTPPPSKSDIEPVSPIMKRAKPIARTTHVERDRDAPKTEEPAPSESKSQTRTSKRRASARDRSPHSVTSSTADGSLRARTRSQSVSTIAGVHAASDDRPPSRNGVKVEPSTPATALEDTESIAQQGRTTRTRRGTLQSQPMPPSKRKRQESPVVAIDDQESKPTSRSNTVTATRNFVKMSSAIMSDIGSHKHATYFAKEVREKDAPGYRDIVRQPQNLKSIRSAITAGGRAIAAASSALESPSGSPGASSTTIELERTIDLIPPKAIVNGAQLEKELMRMFANAYMFNPGEDGMALSTQEMYQDVEQKISDWRGTEREAGGDDEEEGKSKRRKL